MIERILADELKSSTKSVLLIGPRQTGKSTLIRSFAPDLSINLANETEFLRFSSNSAELAQRLTPLKKATIFIDEIQRVPSLLNTIQSLIDEHPDRYKFFLTGSSARKLKRGQANLLPGRIHNFTLSPLLLSELKSADSYGLNTTAFYKKLLSYGSLPGIWLAPSDKERTRTLLSYAGTYVKEEVQAEALTRNLEGFSRFLFVAANHATKFLDFTKLASEAAITRASATRFFDILEDTLIFQRVLAFSKSNTRRLIQHPRYFVFDNGVLNALLGNFTVSPDRIGYLFENLFLSQLMGFIATHEKQWRVSSYRTENSAEVDFILETQAGLWAIELKPSSNVGHYDLKGLNSFAEYYKAPHQSIIAYLGEEVRKIQDTDVLPWDVFFQKLKELA